jgi:hypothetical protein
MTGILAGVAAARPAGGAALGQVALATGFATAMTAALLWLGMGHRNGSNRVLARAAGFTERVSGLPGWAALPGAVSNVGLLTAVFGMYWDIALHIDNGRDPGPLANPAHYFILLGLFAIFAAGWLSICLPTEKPGRAALRITRDWEAPVGGVLLMACSSFALLGFPLDDVWHRLFGQDVTLWGPTHMMMIGGAGMSLIGILVLLVEGHGARRGPAEARHEEAGDSARTQPPRGLVQIASLRKARLIAASGGLLVGLSTFQGEFDFGVPQFRLEFEPVLLALAAGLALVATRVIIGRGAALGAVVFFWAIRGGLALLVGGIFGETTPHIPLYVAEALTVEALAFAVPVDTYRFGAIAGALIGSVGTLTEAWWSHVAMPIPWPAHFLPSALALSVPAGIAAGLLGAFAGAGLRLRGEVLASRAGWLPAAGSLAAIVAIFAFIAPTSVPAGVSAHVTLAPAGEGRVIPTVRYQPAGAVQGPDWLDAIAWQGHGVRALTPLKQIAPGVYRAGQAVPVGGEWKALLRFHRGREMAVAPIYMPADAAIPGAKEIPATPSFDRALVADKTLLQRERKTDVPLWTWGAMSMVVAALSLLLLSTLGWGLVRLARRTGSDQPDSTEDQQWRFSRTPAARSRSAAV